MWFGVLGALSARDASGASIRMTGATRCQLLAALLSRSGVTVPPATLIQNLWGDGRPRSAAKTLQSHAPVAVLLAALIATGGCSSRAPADHSPSVPAPATTKTTTPPPSSIPPPPVDLGFDFVYDTVSSSFTDGKVWINRRGVSHALPGHGYGLVNPLPSLDGRSLLVKRLPAAAADPGSGGIAVIDLTGKVLKAVPHTAGCFPGGWAVGGKVVLGCGQGTDETTWKAYLVRISDGTRRTIAPTCAGCGGGGTSPDGKTIEYGDGDKVYFRPVNLGKPTRILTNSPGGAWTRDGKHLLAATDAGGGRTTLQLLNLDGSHVRTLVSFDWQHDLTYMQSPDGKHIILAGSSDTPNNFWEVGSDGKGLHQLPSSLFGGDPAALP